MDGSFNLTFRFFFNSIHKGIAGNMIISRGNDELVYSKTELIYLCLYAHGFSSDSISEYFNGNKVLLKDVMQNITTKEHSRNWLRIMFNVFKKSILNKEDFTHPLINKVCVSYSKLLLEMDFSRFENSFITYPNILGFFYHECEATLVNHYNQLPEHSKLIAKEKRMLTTRYNYFSNMELINQGNGSVFSIANDQYLTKISKKLESFNWFSIFKKVIEYRLLELPQIDADFIQSEQIKTKMNILNLRLSKKYSKNELQLHIYQELLSLYAAIEFRHFQNADLLY
ncbi:hypothetical protein JCM19297_621 [Nonlabens ulvanivorans]|nr:hypothetical protein JCM19297_621 [Nonlabens ulvanivorans]